MSLGVGFFYVDIGRPWWTGATERLVQSARDCMPDCFIEQMTDNRTARVPGVDGVSAAQTAIYQDTLMISKGWMWANAGRNARRNTVLCDADVQFSRSFGPLFEHPYDVALMRRAGGGMATAQPYLAALALTKPTPGARAFWSDYADVLQSIPRTFAAWWCDQLAFAALLGSINAAGDEIRTPTFHVKLFDAEEIIPGVWKPGAYATHYKGHHEEKEAVA